MDPLRVLATDDGFFTREAAHAAGLDDRSIQRQLGRGVWTRVRPGAYTFVDLWQEFDIAQRHVLTGRAVARRLGGRVALSHTTAALDHGLTVWGADLGQVHVTRLAEAQVASRQASSTTKASLLTMISSNAAATP